MAATSLAIETEALTRRFGPVAAVDGVSLTVPAGIVFGLLGPNGAGKTTMIRLLLGLLPADAGCARVLGYDVSHAGDAVRRRSGALLEHPGLYERLSALDNLDFYARAWGLSAADRGARMRELLTGAGLWERRGERVAGWSRGMKQQLAIARALLHRPSLVFLDEPTAGLDPIATVTLRETIAGLAARAGVTVFLTTHNLAEAEKVCQRIAIIRHGRVVAGGAPDELRALRSGRQLEIAGRGFTPQLLALVRRLPTVASAALRQGELVVDLAGSDDATAVLACLAGAGAEIAEVRKARASLEDVILELMKDPP